MEGESPQERRVSETLVRFVYFVGWGGGGGG